MNSTAYRLYNNVSKIKLVLNNVNKKCMFSVYILLHVGSIFSQKLVYDNFEGIKFINYGERSGVLDTISKNPKIDGVVVSLRSRHPAPAMHGHDGRQRLRILGMRDVSEQARAEHAPIDHVALHDQPGGGFLRSVLARAGERESEDHERDQNILHGQISLINTG